MPTTGILATANSRLGSFVLASVDSFTGDIEVNQTLTITQSLTKSLTCFASNVLVMTSTGEIASVQLDKDANNALVITQTLARALTLDRAISQSPTILQSIAVAVYRTVVATQSLTINQLAAGVVTRPASNTLVLSQDADVEAGKHVVQSLSIDSIVSTSNTINRTLFSVLIPSQSVSLNTTIRRTIAQTLVLNQNANGNNSTNASNTLTLSQSASAQTTRIATNTLVITQSLVLAKTVGRTISHVLTITQQKLVNASRDIHANNVIGFNQFAKGNKVLVAEAENELTLSQYLTLDVFAEEIDQTITITQDVDCSKLSTISASNILVLSQSLVLSKNIVREVSQTITFLNNIIKSNGQVIVPPAQGVLVKKLVVLRSNDSVITLPPPEFGDSKALSNTINIKRTMTGDRYVYKRTNPVQKLNYSFIFDREKALELREFVLNNNSKQLTLTNWKGEIWKVQLTNNPFQFSEDGIWNCSRGNKSSISLEFQGVKVN